MLQRFLGMHEPVTFLPSSAMPVSHWSAAIGVWNGTFDASHTGDEALRQRAATFEDAPLL
jgi:hypothetical protein